MTLRHPVGDPYPSSTLFRDNDSRRTTMNGSTSPARPGLCPSSVRVQNRIGLKRARSESRTLLIFGLFSSRKALTLNLGSGAARCGDSSPPSRIISAGRMRCSGAAADLSPEAQLRAPSSTWQAVVRRSRFTLSFGAVNANQVHSNTATINYFEHVRSFGVLRRRIYRRAKGRLRARVRLCSPRLRLWLTRPLGAYLVMRAVAGACRRRARARPTWTRR
jgi:hypothetical protein